MCFPNSSGVGAGLNVGSSYAKGAGLNLGSMGAGLNGGVKRCKKEYVVQVMCCGSELVQMARKPLEGTMRIDSPASSNSRGPSCQSVLLQLESNDCNHYNYYNVCFRINSMFQ